MTIKRIILAGFVVVLAATSAIYLVPLLKDLRRPVLIGDGDSIMATGAPLHLLNGRFDYRYKIVNLAVSGNKVGQEVLDRNLQGIPNGTGFARRRIVWLIGGTNDLGRPSGNDDPTAKLLDDVETYFRRLHDLGFAEEDCLYTDILPRVPPYPDFEANRQRFNSDVRERLRGLAIVVPSGDDPEFQDPTDKNWFVDGLHPTPSGSKKLADDAFAVLNAGR